MMESLCICEVTLGTFLCFRYFFSRLNNIFYVTGDFWTIDTMFYSLPLRENIIKYMYIFLSGLDMYSFNIGAAVPSMTVKILEGIQLKLPTPDILGQFEKMTKPLFERQKLLNGGYMKM